MDNSAACLLGLDSISRQATDIVVDSGELRGGLRQSISPEFIAEYRAKPEDILAFVIALFEKTGLTVMTRTSAIRTEAAENLCLSE